MHWTIRVLSPQSELVRIPYTWTAVLFIISFEILCWRTYIYSSILLIRLGKDAYSWRVVVWNEIQFQCYSSGVREGCQLMIFWFGLSKRRISAFSELVFMCSVSTGLTTKVNDIALREREYKFIDRAKWSNLILYESSLTSTLIIVKYIFKFSRPSELYSQLFCHCFRNQDGQTRRVLK